MFKKTVALVLAVIMTLCCFAFTSCTQTDNGKGKLKVGIILVGDENEGYTKAHIDGINAAVQAIGADKINVTWKYSVQEDNTCHDAALDLYENGCTLIISNSYGHQDFMKQAATECKDATFVSLTGDKAKFSELDNYCNAFTGVYESRYVSGIVAGMKIKELVDNNKLKAENYDKDNKVKVGYVGAYPYAEVVSGYTAFFLGIKSVYENVSMEVTYTNKWFSESDESTAAQALASKGCVIIGQHADSTGAPSAIQALHDKGQEVYSVGYNVDMLNVAKTAALTSATNNWAVYYTYAFNTALKGEKIAQNWTEGYKTGAVAITALGTSCAAGTQEKVDAAINGIKDGTLHVFDVTKFTVTKGEKLNVGATVDANGHLTAYLADINGDFTGETDVIKNGVFEESDASEFRSAPYFDVRIDGITELN